MGMRNTVAMLSFPLSFDLMNMGGSDQFRLKTCKELRHFNVIYLCNISEHNWKGIRQ